MKIDVNELRELLNHMLDHAEDKLGNEIELDTTMFWTIILKEGLKINRVPDPTMADMRDEVKDLMNTYNDQTRLFILDYEKMGNVIKAIGYQIFEK